MISKPSVIFVDNNEFNLEHQNFADGMFHWVKGEDSLKLSQSLSTHLSTSLFKFIEALPDDFFNPVTSKEERGFHERSISFIGETSQEINLSFRCILDRGGFTLGYVYLMCSNTPLNPIKSVYQGFSIRALSSGFAHEISNPLAIISSISDWFTVRLNNSEVDVVQYFEKVDLIKKNVSRIQAQITGIETTVQEVALSDENFFLKDSVTQMLKIFSQKIQNQQVIVELNVSKNVDLLGDRVLISQILFSLFSIVITTAGAQEQKAVAINSSVEGSNVLLSFKIAGEDVVGGDFFYQAIHIEVIEMLLADQGGSLVKKLNTDGVEFLLSLRKKL